MQVAHLCEVALGKCLVASRLGSVCRVSLLCDRGLPSPAGAGLQEATHIWLSEYPSLIHLNSR